MKYALALVLMMSQVAFAESVKCISEDAKFEIVADIDFDAKKIYSMDYIKQGSTYLSFSNLDMTFSRSFWNGHKATYDVVFSQSALYMELIVEDNGAVYGNFLPKNSVVAFERQITCEKF